MPTNREVRRAPQTRWRLRLVLQAMNFSNCFEAAFINLFYLVASIVFDAKKSFEFFFRVHTNNVCYCASKIHSNLIDCITYNSC